MPKLICIKKFQKRIDADMAKSYLEANGVKSEVFVDHCFGIGQALQDSAPVARLMVNEQDAEKAGEILEGLNNA
jgi:hypothetical protein